MAGLAGLLVIAAVIIAALALGRVWRGRIRRHGAAVIAWRWLSGSTWHGKPVTDAGWLRPGRKALTPTGYATRWHHLPRWQRAAWRSGMTLAFGAPPVLWLDSPAAGVAGAATLLAGLSSLGAHRARRWLTGRRHRSNWLYPLHITLGPVLAIPATSRPESWIQVEPDRKRAVLELPPAFEPDAKMKARIVSVASAKLGMEAPEARWQIPGPRPRLELVASAPPPLRVTLADVREAIDAARDDELVWGLGKQGRVVKSSLSGDSPHLGLSMGSGAGKSVTARAILAQMLYHGAIGLILDFKMISHQWADGLPNVVIARRPAEIHRALMWLGVEVNRRNEVALAGADIDGNVHAAVGPRLVVICEELNATVGQLRKYWRQQDEKGRSPALDALDSASFMGRQVNTNLVYIGQRLSVRAAGGDGDARENIGVIAFGRYSPSNWKMLAGEHAMPPKSLTPGRIQVVADGVTETQAVFLPARQARHLATAGRVALLPHGMPGHRSVTAGAQSANAAPEQGGVTMTALPPVTPHPVRVTLREAAAAGVVSCTLAALQQARHRDGDFPARAGLRGLAHEYDAAALAAWDEARTA
jgi:hypothetical protein